MRILAVGVATLDIINRVVRYPTEDDEVRAQSQRISRGGNAANSLVVLNQLGHTCSWAGVLSNDAGSVRVVQDLEDRGISLDGAVRYPGGCTPTSYVTLSADNGSRTIVHYRDLPEYGAEAFGHIDLGNYDWVHFEGRNTEHLARMLRRVSATEGVGCSLEVEKPRSGIEELFPDADLLLFPRAYARAKGFSGAEDLLLAEQLRCPGSRLYCAWGSEGGVTLDESNLPLRQAGFPPPRVVDTLGAGDVFNAAVIHGHLLGLDPEQILRQACQLAGRKCGQQGLDHLIE
jgi:ketohexokinase